jgi:type I restriction-modification system DNA methylase subunit
VDERRLKGKKTLNGKIMPRKKKKRDSEFQSYTYIKNELEGKGWNVKNPNRDLNGQLYTQRECLQNPEIEAMLGGLFPEYIVKIREDIFGVIEAKPTLEEIDDAFKEAIDYAKKINKHAFIRAKIVSGVAGNDIDRYMVKSGFWDENKRDFLPITYNENEITSLPSPEVVNKLLEQNSSNLKDYEPEEKQFIKIAEEINERFHSSSIKKDQRASIIATILLSLLGQTEPNYNAEPDVFVKDINTRAEEVLKRQGKGNFFQYIGIKLPEKESAQKKFKDALVKIFFLLKKVEIKAAMKAGSDVLGKFYEVFLKYGNGAKDLGILLTPRHITKFAVEVLDVNHRDIVYDPCCGTGGFLVSSFHYVKERSENEQVNIFKQYRIFGLDQESVIATLAITNMLFRGDGKNNIYNDNCFANALISTTIDGHSSAIFVSKDRIPEGALRLVTKVLMNPPFALEEKDEKEYKFIDHALEQMEHGGILFSIFPGSGMVKQEDYLKWRKRLLKNNTLLSVISLPFDLFYPFGLPTVAIIVKKGIPHPENQNILWIKIANDGYVKSKGKRLPDPRTPDDFEKVKDTLKAFINNPFLKIESIEEFIKATPIDLKDNALELLPEVYLDERKPTIEDIKKGLDGVIRKILSFIIAANKEDDFRKEVLLDTQKPQKKSHENKFVEIPITKIFTTPIKTGDFHVSGILDGGKIPLISCSDENNGVEGLFDIPLDKTYKNAITIACDGQPLASFYHYYTFAAKDNVMVCFLREKLKLTTIFFIILQLNRLRWRFSYGRKCYLNKVDKIKIFVPLKDDNEIDEDYIENLVKECPAWDILCKLFQK